MASTGTFDGREDHAVVSSLRKCAYSRGGMGTGLTDYLISSFTMIYHPVIFKANAAATGVVVIVPRLCDAVTDPVMGQISDCTRKASLHGRCR